LLLPEGVFMPEQPPGVTFTEIAETILREGQQLGLIGSMVEVNYVRTQVVQAKAAARKAAGMSLWDTLEPPRWIYEKKYPRALVEGILDELLDKWKPRTGLRRLGARRLIEVPEDQLQILLNQVEATLYNEK
jgi:hypothetical protein